MKRRSLLLYCGGISFISGCINREVNSSQSQDNNSANNDTEGSDDTASYVISVSQPSGDIKDDSNYCQIDDLPPGAQNEVRNAIEDQRSSSSDGGDYSMSERPTLLDTNCYASYVEYEDKYYFVTVDSLGG